MKQLLYATTNNYKVQSANTILKKFSSIRLKKLADGAPDIPEIQTSSQEEVAIDKARKYYAYAKEPLIVMDSGLFIEGLKGFPGVYTKHALETVGVDGLILLASQLENRRAYTQRTIAFTDGSITQTFSSRCHGAILLEKRGSNGRDYDLIFHIPERAKTIAEMKEDEKTELTGHAWQQLVTWLEEYSS